VIALILLILAGIWLLWTATVFIRVMMNLGAALVALARIAGMGLGVLLVQAAATGLRWAINAARRPELPPSGNVVSLDQYRARARASR
jgi:hypothetical protein